MQASWSHYWVVDLVTPLLSSEHIVQPQLLPMAGLARLLPELLETAQTGTPAFVGLACTGCVTARRASRRHACMVD